MLDLSFENGIKIKWEPGLDGGGSTQYIDFLIELKKTGKKYKHCLEWCSGLGAIGYSILDAGICEHVSFMDVYEPAMKCTLDNAQRNNVVDKVTFYHLDSINKLPKDIKFDLVIGNPPHTPIEVILPEKSTQLEYDWTQRLTVDMDWNIHKEFFSNIRNYITDDADIILSEIGIFYEHLEFAKQYGLRFVKSIPAKDLSSVNTNNNAVLMYYEKEIH